MRSRENRGRRRQPRRNASSWSSGCDDSAIEALFAVVGSNGGKFEYEQDCEVIERRRRRDPAKRKSVTFADCQEVLEMSE